MKKICSTLLLLFISLSLSAFDYVYQGVSFKCKVSGRSVTITSFSVKATQVVIPAKVTYKGSEYAVRSVSTFLNGVNYLAETLVLEEGIEDIDKFAFNEFRKLTSVQLPSTIRHIGRNAFRDNPGMTFALVSDIDEQALRKGLELSPTGTLLPESERRPLMARAEAAATPQPAQPQAAAPAKKPAPSPKPAAVSRQKQASPQPAKPVKSATKAPAVDVDTNIPAGISNNADTYCVIIANEKYEDVPEVEYAARDGEVFREYCQKTLGVPEKQIKTFVNASYTDIKRAMNWIETIANVTEGKSKFIFYYAGHGIPSEQDQTAYLIPVDGFPKDLSTCYKLSDMYSRLGRLSAQGVTVLMDACFSGVKRGSDQMLVAARGVAVKAKQEPLSGNLVVFTAASGDETALAYQEKQHGMFTYFLLDKLKQTKGRVTFGELFRSISSQVKKNSILENDKLQTPSVSVSAGMQGKWESLHF